MDFFTFTVFPVNFDSFFICRDREWIGKIEGKIEENEDIGGNGILIWIMCRIMLLQTCVTVSL